jgi:hypothetical protein
MILDCSALTGLRGPGRRRRAAGVPLHLEDRCPDGHPIGLLATIS